MVCDEIRPVPRTLRSDLYSEHDVPEYWLVDPDAQTATVMTLGEDGFETASIYGRSQTLTSPTLPGLALDLDDLF